MEQKKTGVEYDRYLSPLDVWAIAFGCAVGWGAFVMPGTTFLPIAGPLGTAVSMVISVGIMLVIGANFYFLMKRLPGTGGLYAYTKAAFGRDHAFLCAWFLTLSYLTILFLNATSLFLVIRMVFGRSLQIGYQHYSIAGNDIFMGEVGASIIALAGIGLLFINAKPFLQRLQTILALVLLAAVAVLSVICIPHMGADALRAVGTRDLNPVFGVFSLVMLAPWAFVGFEAISLETAHYNFKQRRIRWILLFSIVLCGAVYIALSLISVSSVPDGYASWQAYIADLGSLEGVAAVPTFNAAKQIMGNGGVWLMALAAFAAILTGIIAAYRATTRMLSTMAEDNILSDRFSRTTYSILFIMVVSILISIFGRDTLECFMELTSLGAIIGFGYTSAAAWVLARRSGKRAFAVTGAVGTFCSLAFLIDKLIPGLTAYEAMSQESLLLLMVWCALGFLFYLRTVTRSDALDYNGTSTSCMVLFALLLYAALMWLFRRLAAADTVPAVRSILLTDGTLTAVVIFLALGVMTYILHQVYRRYEELSKSEEAGKKPADSGKPD